jgi:hypothetical protein
MALPSSDLIEVNPPPLNPAIGWPFVIEALPAAELFSSPFAVTGPVHNSTANPNRKEPR